MRVTLPYAAATRPSALPHVQVCDTARKKIVSRSLGTGSKFLNDFSRARARGDVGGESSPAGAALSRRRGDRITTSLLQCISPLVAQSGHSMSPIECPLL